MLDVQCQVKLNKLNTLALSSIATNYLCLDSITKLEELCEVIKIHHKYFILGGGSNIILPKQYSGLIIHNQLKGIQFEDLDKEFILAHVMSGEIWDDFVVKTLEYQAYGLENLSLIPGTTGAAPVQNIGAYGVEVKNFIHKVYAFDLKQQAFVEFSNLDCQFAYRDSYFKHHSNFLIIKISFKLLKTPKLNVSYGDVIKKLQIYTKPKPENLRQVIIKIRTNRLPNPLEFPNVGSFFHNPMVNQDVLTRLLKQFPNLIYHSAAKQDLYKLSAGWLIDNLGLKGIRQGNIGTYFKQALVIVNYGYNTTQEEILSFATYIQQEVYSNYQINLNIEPIILCS